MLKTLAILAVASTALAGAAQAQDYQKPNFGGPRIEVQGGWDMLRADATVADSTGIYKGHDNSGGFVGGLAAGYDVQLGNFVVGAEAGATFATTKDCGEVFGGDRYCIKPGRDLEIGLRVGTLIDRRNLIYVKAAYVNGQLRESYKDFVEAGNDFSDHLNRGGYRVGAGLQTAITPSLYTKVEYRYTDYKDLKSYSEGEGSTKLAFSRHQIVAAAGYHF
jgi:outer membrane immunogenic protein